MAAALHLLRAFLLASELLLVATHAKVLCCVGAPYPEPYLRAQRFRYFAWNLASVQAAYLAAEPGLRQLDRIRTSAAAAAAAANSGYLHTSRSHCAASYSRGNGTDSSAGAARAPARSNQSAAVAAAAASTLPTLCTGAPGGDLDACSSNGTYVGVGSADPLLCPVPEPVCDSGAKRQAGGGRVADSLPQLLQLRALTAAVVMGHTALHLFYITAWERPHARQVVAMSAVRSRRERLRRFPAAQVALYCAGTGFDIAAHLALAGALALALAAA
ncbi:hypothetical protein HXX76_008464 [Chlamydomonas incerta]|uniref:GPI mannosyltransferase 2 n=1 Tax=Chlamydomonas incerta TaxID=51695 RepID=A0A835W297_CHLIN|nr:hypothetical protein HXX76_008464 [Chlamydomonas incerta]|eukprot:KAG2433406.1 hypothetical protein HXX76_008464 [Chlamydomonas incerta]